MIVRNSYGYDSEREYCAKHQTFDFYEKNPKLEDKKKTEKNLRAQEDLKIQTKLPFKTQGKARPPAPSEIRLQERTVLAQEKNQQKATKRDSSLVLESKRSSASINMNTYSDLRAAFSLKRDASQISCGKKNS